ncbi:Ferric uptake regulation protein [subsurface metagenome]
MKSAKIVFRQYLKDTGMHHSERREQIMDIFLQTERHPTIDDLYELVRRKNPKIGLATVYRAMRAICNAGLARETDFGDGVKRFEHKYQHQHHDHLVCLKCGSVIEVMSPEIEDMQEKLAKKHNFTAIRHRMQIFGTCRKCKRKGK